jgi:hypothetical protein
VPRSTLPNKSEMHWAQKVEFIDAANSFDAVVDEVAAEQADIGISKLS